MFSQRIWDQFPVPTLLLTTICNASSRGYDALIWPPQVLRAHGVEAYMQAIRNIYFLN